jgi:hypothetical protein
MKKFKFRVGQVIYKDDVQEYLRISHKYRDDDGTTMYVLAWKDDADYDCASEKDLRRLHKSEESSPT